MANFSKHRKYQTLGLIKLHNLSKGQLTDIQGMKKLWLRLPGRQTYNFWNSNFLILPIFKWLLSKILRNNFQVLNRHFSHVSKRRIFKNLNVRKKADRNFCGNFLQNHFKHLKLYSNSPSWLTRSRCHMGTFWKTKDWSSHF